MTINAIGNNYMKIESTGEITYPLQCAFFAYLAADKLNVTGNSTDYTVPFDTESFDRNSDFNTGTGRFVAPVTGIYLLSAAGLLIGAASKNTCYVSIYNNTTAAIILRFKHTWATTATRDMQSNVSGLRLLTAGDSISVQVKASGSGSNDSDLHGNLVYTYFCGKLVS